MLLPSPCAEVNVVSILLLFLLLPCWLTTSCCRRCCGYNPTSSFSWNPLFTLKLFSLLSLSTLHLLPLYIVEFSCTVNWRSNTLFCLQVRPSSMTGSVFFVVTYTSSPVLQWQSSSVCSTLISCFYYYISL